MRSLLLAVLAAYLIAAIHSILAFINKRLALQRVAQWSIGVGFVLHTGVLIDEWAVDGHYPLFSLRETLTFLAWAQVAVYGVVVYRYRAQAVGAFTMPLISVLTFSAMVINSDPNTSPAAFGATWLFPIHTTILIFAYAAFSIVFMRVFFFLRAACACEERSETARTRIRPRPNPRAKAEAEDAFPILYRPFPGIR